MYDSFAIARLIDLWLAEDVGHGDGEVAVAGSDGDVAAHRIGHGDNAVDLLLGGVGHASS